MVRYIKAGLLALSVVCLPLTFLFFSQQQAKEIELLEKTFEKSSRILKENSKKLGNLNSHLSVPKENIKNSSENEAVEEESEEELRLLDEKEYIKNFSLKDTKGYVLLHKEDAFEVWGHKDSVLREKEFTFRTLGKKESFSVKGFEVQAPQGESLYCFQPYREFEAFCGRADKIWTGSNVTKASSWELKTMPGFKGTIIGNKDWSVQLRWSE